MKSGFKIVEKIIAIALIICAGLMMYTLTTYFNSIMKYAIYESVKQPKVLLIFQFLKHTNAIIFLCLAEVVAGILLLLNRRPGWITAMMVLLSNMLLPVVSVLISKTKIAHSLNGDDDASLVMTGWILTFALLLIILFLKPFRLKYLPTIKTYFIIVGLSGLILADYVIS